MRLKKIRFSIAGLFIGKHRANRRRLNALYEEHFELVVKYVAFQIINSIPEYQKGWLGEQLSKAPVELLRDAIKLNANLTEIQKTQISNIIENTPQFKGDYLR